MTDKSAPQVRAMVLSKFARIALRHALVACSLLGVFSIFPFIVYGRYQQTTVRTLSIVLLCWVVYIQYCLARQQYAYISTHLDLAKVPVQLAMDELRRYRYLWPHTALTIVLSFLSVLSLQLYRPPDNQLAHGLFWGVLCYVPFLGLYYIGSGIQALLLRLYAPSLQERYAEIAEAMEAGSRAKSESAGDRPESGKFDLPFDRPPV